MLKEALVKLALAQSLSADEAASAMGEIMDGAASPAQIAAFLTALRMKGETVDEIAGCARAMRQRSVKIDAGPGVVLDTCGTGGDGLGTFNISTVAAFVVAACGVKVAKHGNRAASSKCGSADLLEALGVRIENPREKLEIILREVGIAYLHAPNFHPAMKHAGPVRKELGFRTIFNLLGPICNPANANVQVIGVFAPQLVRPLAEVLQALGTTRAFTFHGHGGLDELSTTGENRAVDMNGGRITEWTIGPETAGLLAAKSSDLLGGLVADNVAIARDILAGKKGPKRDIVVLNAAIALVAAGQAKTPREGAAKAADALDSGAARMKLEQLAAATQ
ncbi:MAG TPA: anthranilate phosphoribosyltransferase [Planctomycetota bacterium]|nr:anthranilate phosphoribosyltransferase [Planctomycetota bacterium]